MNLNMLLEVGSRCEGLTAGLANKRLFLCMYALVPIQIGFLIKSLLTVLIVALVRLDTFMNEFMPF
jgi:hypothetical protein